MLQRILTATRKLVITFACTCAVSLLAGCAGMNATPIMPPIERPTRASIDAFSLDGRISIREGERRNAANIFWQHAPDRDEMLFSTPLGQGLAELTRDAGGAHLRLADHREFAAADWEGLARQLFGVSLPLSALPRWVIGAALQGSADKGASDAAGRPQWRLIDGWRIDYRDYESSATNALPTLIELRRDADDIEMRIKVDAWTIP